MKEIGEGLSRVDQAVGQTQEKLEQYHAAHEETIRESSKELQKQISGVREQLADAQETLSDTLKEMAQKGQLHQEELLKAVSGIGRCGQKDTGAVNGNRGERTESACRARYRFKGRDG